VINVRFLSVSLILFCGLSVEYACAAQPPAHKAKILFVTQSKGFVHGSVNRRRETLAPAEIALTQMGQQTGLFEVHCTQDCLADFTRENLKNYDIVAFYTTLDLPILVADFDYFWRVWLREQGHGVIGFHSATDTFHELEPYWDMIGGTFNGHPWGSNNKVTITVHDTQHPASRPFGAEFQTKDEIYQYVHWQPDKVHVLMSLNMEKCHPKKPYQVPVAWVKNYGHGKVFYTNLGHNETTWTNQTFLKSVEGGVRWVLGLESGDATPNPEVSKAEEAKAKAAATK
jgi:type 1 glutamine amidotransferase